MTLSKSSLLLIGLALLIPVAAVAYQTQGKGSRGGREITYYNAVREHGWAVARAVRAWNESGARIEFVPASRADAELVISGGLAGFDGHAKARIRPGRPRPGDARVILPAPAVAQARDARFKVALIAAHELGHVLRLDHEDAGCALMNSTIVNDAPARCPQPPAGKWRCGLVGEDDVRGAVALYGGERRPPRRLLCPKFPQEQRREPRRASASPSPAEAVEVQASYGRRGRVSVRWRNGEDERIRSAVTARDSERCPSKPSGDEAKSVPAKAGAPGEVTFPLVPERSCYAVWMRDRSGKLSRRAATAWLKGPRVPEAPANFTAEPILSLALGNTGASLEWRNAESDLLREVILAREEGRCPAHPPHRSRAWNTPSARADSSQEYFDLGFYPAGGVERYCYAAWSRDRFGRLSRPVTTWPRRQAEDEKAVILAR